MKSILFYVEPMPIRNTYTAFLHYPKIFSKFILESGEEYKAKIFKFHPQQPCTASYERNGFKSRPVCKAGITD